MKSVKIRDGGIVLGYIHFNIDYSGKTKEEIINDISKRVKRTSVGYAGWNNKNYLKQHLEWHMYDDYTLDKINLNKGEIIRIIEESLVKCHRLLNFKPIRIFLFPEFSSFVRTRMSGIGGDAVSEGTMCITVNPSRGWKTALKETICHELNHLVANYHFHNPKHSMLRSIIYEGLAEHFREYVVGGEKAPWAAAMPKKKSMEIFSALKNDLNKKMYDHDALFFGAGDKYPQWAGYSIGYQLTKDFLNKNPNLTWPEIMKISPKRIAKESGWLG